MSKAQVIRKRALDLVRDQDWPNAIREYRRLVELDQNNPNVHNELADLYIKTNQKTDAYDAFVRAIDEYVRVGLFNNAVAVCKKVLRVLPGRTDVLIKLGFIRSRQGLAKEAESYYISFLEKAGTGNFEATEFLKLAAPIADDMAESRLVLDRLAQSFVGYGLNEEAANTLVRLVLVCEKERDGVGAEKARAQLEKLGFAAKLDVARGQSSPTPTERTVITEDNIWTKSHTEGERIEIESTSHAPTGSPAAPASQPAGAAPGGPSERDLYLLRLARGSAEPRRKTAPASAPAAEGAAGGANADDADDAVVATEAASAPHAARGSDPASAGSKDGSRPANPGARPAAASPAGSDAGMQISALIDEDASASGEADYRSHYDLGMAYLEMDLLPEAIREYQTAAKSPQYQVKCLEMIGLCFIKQSQPQLAIRQLSKGLTLIGTDSEESLGIKYNLGLAYEMVGDLANARTYFEDVYVVDVTFRDVSEKVRNLTGSS